MQVTLHPTENKDIIEVLDNSGRFVATIVVDGDTMRVLSDKLNKTFLEMKEGKLVVSMVFNGVK